MSEARWQRLDSIESADRRHQGRPPGRRHRRRGPRERGRPDLRRRAGHARAGRLHGPVHVGLHLRRRRPRPTPTGSTCRRCSGSTRTAAAPPTPSPSTPARASPPASPPPTGRTPSGCWPTAATTSADLARPGHIVPLRAKDGGVLRRPGHTEAAVDLAVLAGPAPGRRRSARSSARRTRPAWPAARSCGSSPTSTTSAMISIADLIAYRKRFDKLVERVAEATVPAGATATFTAVGYRSSYDEREHVAFVYGDIGDGEDVLVRVHSECLTGDVFGSLRCDCGPQLQAALAAVAAGGPRRRALHARARGPRHRPAAQAAGLPAAGRRRATPSTPTSTSACPPTPATTAPARRSWSTSACTRCGC